MEFRRWLENRYRHPVVLVVASPAVEGACRRNGMDFIHTLRPFAVHAGELHAHVGDRADAAPVRNFGVRLTRPQCAREVAPSQLALYFHHLLREQAAMELVYGEQLDRAMAPLLNGRGGVVEGPRLSSQAASQLLERSHLARYTQFIRDYVQLVRCSYFDTIDHPVGCIYAASTREVGGVDGVMRAFAEQQKEPAETRRDMPCMDDDLHSFFILLHDVTEGPSLEEARRMFTAVQTRYGHSNCAFLRVNTVVNPQDVKCRDPSMWIEANTPSLDIPSWAHVRAAQQQQQQQQQSQQQEGAALDTAMKNRRNGATNASSTSSAGTAVGLLNGDDTSNNNAGDKNHEKEPTPTLLPFAQVHTRFGVWQNGTPKITGCHMSSEDVEELRNVMAGYLSQSLFNFLERKLRALVVTVNERRTTTLGKVAAWFRNKDESKSKGDCWVVSNDGEPTKYIAKSLEVQMRRAADLSLVLSDYDLAVHFYRMCRNELLSTLPSREFNRPLIAACQEGIGVCTLLLGRLPLPSLTPWLTGGTASKSSGDCRLETAQNDYVACQIQTYAFRLSLLMYEYCRTRSPPALDRAIATLTHVQRLGVITRNKLYSALVHELLAATLLFRNAPQAAGLTVPAQMPKNFLLRSYIRQYARYTIMAGGLYRDENIFESALRCYLRALRVCGGVGRRGSWQLIFEHLYRSLAYVHNGLGNRIRGWAMTTFALSIGTPMYSNPRSGFQNFEFFWNRQRQMFKSLDYGVCPHMVVPCVVPESMRVSMNVFHCDEVTQRDLHTVDKELVEIEWRRMEDKLRSYYTGTRDISSRQFFRWKEDLSKMQKPNVEGGMRRYVMPLAESLEISVVLKNPVGGPIKAENFSLLYVLKENPEQLWKSASSQTVELEAGASRSVTVSFSPGNEGVYIIIGFFWKLMDLEGYYYFDTLTHKATDAHVSGHAYAFERAVEQPTPNVNSAANLEIEVGPPQAWITATLHPELPPVLRDGEYYQTTLILTNGSVRQKAGAITLQRSPKNAHVVWIDAFGLERNMDTNATFLLEEELEPMSSFTLPITLQAHYRQGLSSQCKNNVLFLFGYTSETSSQERESTPCATSNSSTTCVRLHRFFRRVQVGPSFLLSSTVLPPANATMATAVLVTATNTSETCESPPRVARVMAIFRPRWRVFPTHVADSVDKEAVECMVSSSGAFCIPLSVVNRAPSEVATAATSASQNGLVEELCIPLTSTLPASSKRTLVEVNLGTGIVDSVMNLYFMRCSFRGPGTIGDVKARDSLSFYVDGAGRAKATSTSASRLAADGSAVSLEEGEKEEEESHMAVTVVEPFTSICVAVGWTLEEDGYVHSGQLFHFVDPVKFLCSENYPLVGETHETLQEHLCDSMIENKTLHDHNGAVFYYVEVPDSVESTEARPDAVMIPVTMHCHSLAAHPLLVTVKTATLGGPNAAQMSVSSAPFIFLGKTSCTFLLLPHENYSVGFTACALAPGFVNCNTFELSAVTLRLPPMGEGQTWRTGMSRGALLAALRQNGVGPLCQLGKTVAAATRTGGGVGRGRGHGRGGHAGDHSADIGAVVCDNAQLTIIIGHGVAAITRAVFATFSADVFYAAAEATASRVEAYREDALAHEAKYKEFATRKALLGTSAIATSEDLALYRPRARRVSETAGMVPCNATAVSANPRAT